MWWERAGATLALLSVLGSGCASDKTEGQNDAGSAMDAGVRDAGPPDAGADPRSEICAALDLPIRPFASADPTYGFTEVAGDFAATVLDGSAWRLSDAWSGCGSYTFFAYIPGAEPDNGELWGSRPDALVNTPLNAHFFFLSFEPTEAERRARVEALRERIIDAILARHDDVDERLAQRGRFHFVVDAPSDIEGSVGAFLVDYEAYRADPASRVDLGDRGVAPPPPPLVFAIDREQRWDAAGSMSRFVGGRAAFEMAAFLPGFFDHKAALADRVATAADVQTVVLLDDRVTDRIFVRQATLPSLEGVDRVEVDVAVRCPYRNPFACSEWDRIARVQVCEDEACETRHELVRWITPYWRRGSRRWLMDASALRGLLSPGPQWFRIVMGPEWERATERDIRVALHLSSGDGPQATGAVLAFNGGTFDGTYNTREPVAVAVPAGVSRVELVLILSGHGQAADTNCAEWCDHRHRFEINGTALDEVRHVGEVGAIAGCGAAAARGAPPGQWGNWAPERAYWCPGLPVDHLRIDVTDLVLPGQDNELRYTANLAGAAPGGGNIDLAAYLVWFE